MPAETSLRAFEFVRPELTDRQERVVDVVAAADGALTTREILDRLGKRDPTGWQPRVSELEDMGVLEVVEKRRCTVSRYDGAVKAYEVKH